MNPTAFPATNTFQEGSDATPAPQSSNALPDPVVPYIRTQSAVTVGPTEASGSLMRKHDMRATFASLLAAGGADVKSLCDAMGWKDLNSAKPYLATVREAMKRHVDGVGAMLS